MTPATPVPVLRELFDVGAELAAPARAQWLAQLALDPDLHGQLQAMFAADARADGVLETPASVWAQRLAPDDEDVEALVGSTIGGFRLTALIGQGGSSVVFRAERPAGAGVQQVALKLMCHGLFSNEAQRRFRREQAILAQLSHPHIAHLVDAGISAAGIPYIAMELVEGRTLLAHARERALDQRQRLRLVAQVAHAVNAAHRMLIVHRDLKPGNVLVTAQGEVKVLDFGIAKLLGEQEDTATQHLALTPGYAAPEQYARGPVTTAVDVYALGVLAAELLVGARPGPDARLPAEATAARAAWRALDADLATALRTALATEPARRYASARHFADDLERFLRHEPISARAPSRLYRARKFVARHRLGVAVGVAVALALLAALGLALRAARVAREELARADRLRDFMFEAFAEAEPSVPRHGAATVLDAVHRAIAASATDDGGEPRARIELRTRLGQVLQRQGDLDGARALFERTAEEARQQLGADHALSLELAALLVENAMQRGRFDEARSALDALLRRTGAGDEAFLIAQLSRSAVLATRVRERERALSDARAALARARALGDQEVVRRTLSDYAIVMLSVDAVPEAVAAYEEVLARNRRQFGEHHQKVANTQASLSRAYRRSGDLDKAEAAARAAVAIDRQVYPGDHWNTALHLNALTMVLGARSKVAEELEFAREGLRINRATLGDAHPDTLISLYTVGLALAKLERWAEGLPELREALAGSEREFGPQHWGTAVRRAALGHSLAMSGEVAEGTAQLERAIVDFQALPDPDHDKLSSAIERRVRLALHLHDGATALRWIDTLARHAAGAPVTRASWPGRIACLRGMARLELDQVSEAVEALSQCGAAIAAEPAADALLRTEQAFWLATAYLRAGAGEQARVSAAQARALRKGLAFVPATLVALDAALPAAGLASAPSQDR